MRNPALRCTPNVTRPTLLQEGTTGRQLANELFSLKLDHNSSHRAKWISSPLRAGAALADPQTAFAGF